MYPGQYSQQQQQQQQHHQHYQQQHGQRSGAPQQQYYNAQNVPQQAMQLSPNFQYSSCRGQKKALLVGINYFNQKSALKGCINDVQNMKNHLIQRWGFYERDQRGQMAMICLTDDQRDPNYVPTRQNIINALRWLVGGAQPGDSLFFHFSGHGGLVKDQNGDEASGYDSCIYPVDYTKAGPIVDDELHATCVARLPAGVRLTVICDSCHSGTMMDLPFLYNSDGSLKSYNPMAGLKDVAMDAAKGFMRGGFGIGGLINAASVLAKNSNLLGGGMSSQQQQQVAQQRQSQADVIMFSGCKDNQTSADTFQQEVGSTGAMSYAFLKVINQAQGRQMSVINLLAAVRDILAREYTQKPQLSSGYPMNMNNIFIM
ncbi:hypothetical protein MIR68_007593 [Amoeboaphelidium protococcarum]|nr:hypothetical protein MIR68_007593 [Amoeboaphelidium protococcarum]